MLSSKRESAAADEKFLFVSVPNGKISLQHKMQYQGLDHQGLEYIQFIVFHMNPKLTNGKLGRYMYTPNFSEGIIAIFPKTT